MTNSLAIAPQRQRRDFFKKPQKGPTLAAPAAPPQEPQQVGDQLLDMRRYEPGNQTQAIQAIENFVGNQGGLAKASQWAMEAQIKKAEKDADELRKQRAEAYQQNAKIGEETALLEKKKKYAEAKNNRLANPWTRFFFYDKEAEAAAVEATINLTAWGGVNVNRLARENNDAKIANDLNAKAKEFQEKYSYIPQGFQTGIIEPALAKVQSDIKKKIIEARFELRDEEAVRTGRTTTVKGLKNMLAMIKTSGGGLQKEAIALGTNSVMEAYQGLYTHFGNEKLAAEHLASYFNNLWIDADTPGSEGFGENDFGELATGPLMQRVIRDIKTPKTGISFGDLVMKNGKTISQLIEEGSMRSYDFQHKKSLMRIKEIDSAAKNWKSDQEKEAIDRINAWEDENGRPPRENELKILAGEHWEASDEGARTAANYSDADALKLVYDQYKLPTRNPTSEELSDWESLVENMTNRGERLDDEQRYQLRILGQGRLISKNDIGVENWRSTKRTQLRNTLLRDLQDVVKETMDSSPEMKTIKLQGADGKLKKESMEIAIGKAQRELSYEFPQKIEEMLNDIVSTQGEEALTDPTTRRTIFDTLSKNIKSRPIYSSPNTWVVISPLEGQAIGVPRKPVPQYTRATKNEDGSWNIQPLSLDNFDTVNRIGQRHLYDQPNNVRALINSQFVFDSIQLEEITRALTTGYMGDVSNSTREAIASFRSATNDAVPLSEVLINQITRYRGKSPSKALAERWNGFSHKLENAFVTYDAAPPNFKQTDAAIKREDYKAGVNRDGQTVNRVRFRLVRPVGQVGVMQLPSPISGDIVDSGVSDELGNYIVIRAAVRGTGYKAGDRVVISGGSSIPADVKGYISIGTPIMVTGGADTTTGGLDPGVLQMSIYGPGEGFPLRADQKGQNFQRTFIEQNLYPLIRRTK